MCEKKDYIWNRSTCTCENGKYLGSIIDDSVITDDEIIEVAKTDLRNIVSVKIVPIKAISTKTIPTSFNKKKVTCKIENFYSLPTFLVITVAVLINVSIYCYLGKQPKQKHLLPYYDNSNKLKEI